ncbi:3',5'-cyclic adenosine monophosphate phosphodiesterase CpdA [Novipirellula aureliae]|uniref:3',5'-cyclic adenosine monophosphate phosphodiesterase CpdA n=1 Tax=Novipirellula aureliae TaxID=2527966 RepID=A0A5C6DR99_9BACT|nr:metallophosphoesterase [Novipirellula aureliae]TWU38714.1 3',5'-cyclic adenosine monophosphate phosphodiesterase CpdA [Novipirellula aureliae]
MSLHLIPASRRRFVQASLATAAVTLGCPWLMAATDESADQSADYWALLADTHIAANKDAVSRGVNMFDNLNKIIDELLAEENKPLGVIINGDCARLRGRPGDYATLRIALDRITAAGLPIHMTMGNHDDRDPFYAAFKKQKPDAALVDGKHVAIVPGRHANLFLVDSLNIVNEVSGKLGETQLQWLAKSLAEHRDKTAIVIGHHNPQFLPEGSTAEGSGLSDTAKFIDVLHSQPHVQAYFYGHTHNWNRNKTSGGVHLINQPPCAYVFNAKHPNGWVRLKVQDESLAVELRALNKQHTQHGESHTLEHRFAAVS